MAAVVTYALDEYQPIRSSPRLRKVTISWLSHTDGVAAITIPRMRGRLIKAVTNPSATAPTADYDIVLTDGDGANILANCDDDLTDRHTSNTEIVYFFVKNAAAAALAVHPVVDGAVTVTVSAAGSGKAGTLTLYWDGD